MARRTEGRDDEDERDGGRDAHARVPPARRVCFSSIPHGSSQLQTAEAPPYADIVSLLHESVAGSSDARLEPARRRAALYLVFMSTPLSTAYCALPRDVR